MNPHSGPVLPGRRINVVGTTGSGKTTTAKRLADRLGLRHIEMDALFWRPDWAETPDSEFLRLVDEATQGDGWVLDGNYSRTRPIVWPRADTIVWLDYSFPRTFGQLFRRTVRRAMAREVLWNGCRERLRSSFFSRDSILLWLIKTYRRRRRTYPRLFADPGNQHLIKLRFGSPRELDAWMESLPAAGRSGRGGSGMA